jgi:hypothetical protein
VTTERTRKTEDKTRRGDLPAATTADRKLGCGTGVKCDGCGETITPADMMASAQGRGLVDLYFHLDCYQAWRDSKTS